MNTHFRKTKKSIKKFIRRIFGIKVLQKFYAALYKFALIGMNIGGGDNPQDSGEKAVLQYIKKQLKDCDHLTVFDVGANIGAYALIADNLFDGKASIYSFEPAQKSFQMLAKNCSGRPRIQTFNFGFGDEHSTSTLYSQADGSVLASLYQRNLEHANITMDHSEQIELRTVDAFCDEHKINRIHFLKLDVEGHEYKILEGAKKMLDSNAIEYIQFEFGGCNIASRTYLQDFFQLLQDNYRIYRVVKDGIYLLAQYKEQYEIFIGANYFAERINPPVNNR